MLKIRFEICVIINCQNWFINNVITYSDMNADINCQNWFINDVIINCQNWFINNVIICSDMNLYH